MTTNKYQFNIFMNSPTVSVKIDIPNYLQNTPAKFIVSSIIVKMTTGPSPVLVHSSALRSQELYYSLDGSNSLIATTVGTNIVSNPLNVYLDVGDLGYDWPSSLAFGGDIDIVLKNHLGVVLLDLDYAIITIDVCAI